MVEIVAKVEDIAGSTLQQYAGRIADTMRDLAPVGDYPGGGALKASISVAPAGQFAYIIAPHTEYANIAENGRGAVVPVYAKALKYRDGTFSKYSSPYEGSHFVAKTAAIYR